MVKNNKHFHMSKRKFNYTSVQSTMGKYNEINSKRELDRRMISNLRHNPEVYKNFIGNERLLGGRTSNFERETSDER